MKNAIFVVRPHQFIEEGLYVAEVSLKAWQPAAPSNREADAHLIAAAPELYALAERIIRYFGDGWIDPILDCDIEIRNMARAALAKASGDVSIPGTQQKIEPGEKE